jgi:lysophospholipase L1-like esterase
MPPPRLELRSGCFRCRRVVAGALFFVLVIFLAPIPRVAMASPAETCIQPNQACTSWDPSSGPAETEVHIRGWNWSPSSAGNTSQIAWGFAPDKVVGTITISGDGTFSETIKVPDDAPAGQIAIQVDGDFTLGRDLDFEVTQGSARSPAPRPERTPTPATTPTPAPVPTPTSPSPKPSPEFDYWAGGDSFSSGEGATEHKKNRYEQGTDSKTNGCHRSPKAYAYKVQQRLADIHGENFKLIFRACSGATIRDYYKPNRDQSKPKEPAQRLAIDPQRTKLVTLTLGGNDVGFAAVVENCMSHVRRDRTYNCTQHVEGAMAHVPAVNFAQLYRDLLKDAPVARIMVVGYPRMFDRDPSRLGCTVQNVYHSKEQQRAFNDIVDQLNLRIAAAVKQVNRDQPSNNRRLTYVDVSDLFEGHGICANQWDRWVNHFVLDGPPLELSSYQQSFHPNRTGQSEIAKRVVDCSARGQCNPKKPRKYVGEIYNVDKLISEHDGWRIKLTSYEITKRGLKLNVEYQNMSDSIAVLSCPYPDELPTYLAFPSEQYFELIGRSYCAKRGGQKWYVKPHTTFTAWGEFDVPGMHGGERFALLWMGMGATELVMMWK